MILKSDCFRAETFGREVTEQGLVGGGHSLARFREALHPRRLETALEEDATELIAPSIEPEQNFCRLVGQALHRVAATLRWRFRGCGGCCHFCSGTCSAGCGEVAWSVGCMAPAGSRRHSAGYTDA